MAELKDYITSQIRISEDNLAMVLANFQYWQIAKGKFVLKQGQIASQYFFVKKGGLRIYFNHEEKQITGWIALENEFFCELASLKTQTPSRFNIQAIEPSVLLTISHSKMEMLYKQLPEWQQFGRQVWETAFLKVIDGIITFQTLTAEDRYLRLMQQSDLFERVSLKHLSSYLGISPTSLSRIRKNVK